MNLEECLIDNNHLTSIAELESLIRIKVVDISGNQLRDLSALYHHKLTDLWMSKNPLEAIRELLCMEHKDFLESVSFEGCNCPSTGTCIQILREKFRNIRKINGNIII